VASSVVGCRECVARLLEAAELVAHRSQLVEPLVDSSPDFSGSVGHGAFA
jgi:hypothetical protein